jgi:hypothetical protein
LITPLVACAVIHFLDRAESRLPVRRLVQRRASPQWNNQRSCCHPEKPGVRFVIASTTVPSIPGGAKTSQ